VAFGGPISNLQAIQFMLADMAIQTEAARYLVYTAASGIDNNSDNRSYISACAKTFASDVAVKVALDAMQVLGGYGYMKDRPLERMLRDAKITQIYEGTNQIQRIVISRAVLA
jgi:alkylation response protein AidB-like acyl-CoA dehydrogenase